MPERCDARMCSYTGITGTVEVIVSKHDADGGDGLQPAIRRAGMREWHYVGVDPVCVAQARSRGYANRSIPWPMS